jgi:hypothetical protein
MTRSNNRNFWLVSIIFSMSLIPAVIAWVYQGDAPFITSKTNNGQLIIPVITTERSDLSAIDQFTHDNLDELKGHWLLVNIVPTLNCETACLEAVYKSKQLQLMMNKDLTRIRRIVLFLNEIPLERIDAWFKHDLALLKLQPNNNLQAKLKTVVTGNFPDGALLLMDPLGNFMMYYQAGFDPYKVKKDLTHLLKISQIG